MNKNDLDPVSAYRFVFEIKAIHPFWRTSEYGNYCWQTCFRDDWEMAGKFIDDFKRIKKWFNVNKKYWNKKMVAMIREKEILDICMARRGDDSLI